jgi:hypothetical protein
MSQYRKAVVAALVTGVTSFLSSLLTALHGASGGLGGVTAEQWIGALLAFFVGLGTSGVLVYQVPNASARDRDSASPAHAVGAPAAPRR